MANAREIQGRIKSINDTMKITNAMYMISSTKLQRAKKELAETEPFFFTMQSMIARTVRHMPEMQSRYLTHDPVGSGKKRGFLVITADKGLAGAYNHNVLKLAEEELEKSEEWNLFVVGELGRQYFAGKKIAVDEHFLYTAQHPTFDRARVITSKLLEAYDNGELDEIDIIFTSMKNGMQSETRMERLLPLTQQDFSPTVMQHAVGVQQEEFIFSPSPEAVLESIVPNYVTGYIVGALVESFCSEHNARMMAMEAANDSAKDMLHQLSIEYNRVRQAAITQEITEVVSGAKAQKRKKKGDR